MASTDQAAASPQHHIFNSQPRALSWYEWGTPSAHAPTIFMLHATGFHARCWDKVITALPAASHVIAVDSPGHGLSGRGAPFKTWREIGGPIIELVQHLGLTNAIGVGHSMGGHCLVQAAIGVPGAFQRLLLVDPVIQRPEYYEMSHYAQMTDPADHPIARRRNSWTGWQEMYDRFKDRHPYSLWRPDVLEDYCRYGVVPKDDGSGTYELACPPLMESSVYMSSITSSLYEDLDKVDMPVTVMRAEPLDPKTRDAMDFSKSPTWVDLAGAFKQGRDVYLPHLTHFIPMQDPELVARFIMDKEAALAAE